MAGSEGRGWGDLRVGDVFWRALDSHVYLVLGKRVRRVGPSPRLSKDHTLAGYAEASYDVLALETGEVLADCKYPAEQPMGEVWLVLRGDSLSSA